MKFYVLFSALCLLTAPLASAQSSGPSEDARAIASAHFRRGVELFEEEAYRAALVEFQRAHEVAPDYRLLYNIGQTKLELQDYLGATQSYEGYLREGHLEISPERRAEVEESLSALRERVASVRILVNREDAEVFIDDVKVGTSPISSPVMVNVGRHRVTARSSYGATDTRVVDVAGGDIAKITLELAKPTPQQVVIKDGGRQPWNRAERTAVATWGAAGALGVGALVTGLLATSAKGDLDKLLETQGSSRSAVDNQRSSARTMAITTDVLVATAGAAAIAGTVVWLLGHERSDRSAEEVKPTLTKLRWDVGIGTVGVTGQF